MEWKIEVVKEENQSHAKWSGGITTQLAIYPADGVYAKRNFLWRISTAMVDDAKSTFTSLPGFKRIIMPLRGELLKLNHKEHHKKDLQHLETDTFQGAWTTESEGKVQDYNLMLAKGCDGSMEGYEILSKQIFSPKVDKLKSIGRTVTVGFYLLTGRLTVEQGNSTVTVAKGDFVTFTGPVKVKIGDFTLHSKDEVPAIVACTVVKY